LLGACRSGPQPVAEKPKIPDGIKSYPLKQITTVGNNDRAVYSYDGASIFFIASQRSGHDQPQAYQYFFANQRERRLTFQDGEIESIIPGFKGNEIIYSSSTDEIKESPDFILKSMQKTQTASFDFFGKSLPRTEIYESDINGDKITRLTRSPGYDGDLGVRRNKNEFVFVSSRAGNLDIYTMVKGTPIKVNATKDAEFDPAVSEKGELAFVRGTPMAPPAPTPTPIPTLSSQIFVAELASGKVKAVTSEAAIHLSPSWHPKLPWIVFTMNYPDPKNYEIYWMRKDGKCLERLTYSAENEWNPSFSPDGLSLIFARDVSSGRQLFVMSGLPSQPACPEEVTPTPAATQVPAAAAPTASPTPPSAK
jgi:Tol biopolymer transport system component